MLKKTRIRFIVLILGFILTVSPGLLMAQDDDAKGDFWSRVFTGGNLGLQFGNLTYIDVSPLVGYRITDRIHAGIGVTYIYYKYKDDFLQFETSVYGGRIFGRYYFLENLFGHTEYELLNLEIPQEILSTGEVVLDRDFITSVFAGGGYAQELGPNTALVLMLLFNLTEEQYSPYENPVIRIGINVGF